MPFLKATTMSGGNVRVSWVVESLLIPFLWFPGTSKVNLVKIPSTASSPRDTALAAVICSALATVLLALLVLCVIYCKRQFMEKKPSCEC